jgi:uncharacterized protein
MLAISYDPAKNERNIAERGISFELAAEFDWASALIAEDLREDYGESRYQAIGFIGTRLHVLVFTPRATSVHVISLRKANQREAGMYESKKAQP